VSVFVIRVLGDWWMREPEEAIRAIAEWYVQALGSAETPVRCYTLEKCIADLRIALLLSFVGLVVLEQVAEHSEDWWGAASPDLPRRPSTSIDCSCLEANLALPRIRDVFFAGLPCEVFARYQASGDTFRHHSSQCPFEHVEVEF